MEAQLLEDFIMFDIFDCEVFICIYKVWVMQCDVAISKTHITDSARIL